MKAIEALRLIRFHGLKPTQWNIEIIDLGMTMSDAERIEAVRGQFSSDATDFECRKAPSTNTYLALWLRDNEGYYFGNAAFTLRLDYLRVELYELEPTTPEDFELGLW